MMNYLQDVQDNVDGAEHPSNSAQLMPQLRGCPLKTNKLSEISTQAFFGVYYCHVTFTCH
jgi:hypothetical protein